MLKSTISSKGQITVPVEVRRELGLQTGAQVLFEVRRGTVILRKGTVGPHPVDQAYGTLARKRGTDVMAMLDEMRGPRPGGPRSKRRPR
jgi:AbrB family looped-hinge helix DNA binding protein